MTTAKKLQLTPKRIACLVEGERLPTGTAAPNWGQSIYALIDYGLMEYAGPWPLVRTTEAGREVLRSLGKLPERLQAPERGRHGWRYGAP